MNTPAASKAAIARAIAALESEGKTVMGVLATADKAALVLTEAGLTALLGQPDGARLLTPATPASPDADLDAELAAWDARHAPN